MSTCCPPNSAPYLQASGTPSGVVIETDFSFYITGDKAGHRKGILLIPDVYGWNGGRTRLIADSFAEQGYYTVVPQILTPALDGGTDGDGLPPDFDFATKAASHFVPYMAGFDYPTFSAKFKAAFLLFKAAGVDQIGLIGFCWGGWLLCQILADPEMPPEIKAGVIAHPSVHLEGMVFGRNASELVAKVQRPILLLPAGNDPDRYRAGGDIFEPLKAAQPDSDVDLHFSEMTHGWVPRGDLSDPSVEACVDMAMKASFEYFVRFIA
jgi:dienelactone hydrolase